MFRYLGHEKVVVRFLSLYALGLSLFFFAWFISYLFLPEGVIREFSALTPHAGTDAADTVLHEFWRIFGVNLIGFLMILLGNLILRGRTISFGYLVPLAWMILYGITLGTNSFSMPLAERSSLPALLFLTAC